MTSPFNLDPDISRFLPKEAVFAARTDLSQIRLLGLTEVNADTMTLSLFGLLGRMQTIRHMSGVTDEILGFLSDAHLNIEELILPFDNKTKAVDLARLRIKQGHRIFQIYPLPQGTYRRSALIVPPALWYDLNSKAKLKELVPEEHLASRRIGSSADLRHSGFTGPAWLKLGGPAATGFGLGVRRCVDKKSFLEAIDAFEFLGRGQRIVVEDDVPITESWCANIIVGTDEVAFAGSALQVFQSPGIQSGSMIDPARPLPDAARSIALVAGEIARQRGFIGPAGIDIGQTPQGKLVVFDPNFRVNGSLSQVLLHRGAAARSGLPASLSVSLSSPLPMSEIIRRLRGPVGAAWFMPTRCCDARLLPAIEGQSQVLGFILAPTAAELNLPLAELEALLKV